MTDQTTTPPAPDFPPVDLGAPQATVRTIITGMVLGGGLSLCNVYAGLKIGWGFNMSITAALLAYGFWGGLEKTVKTRHFGLLENNINQTAASAGASISSAGLVAPIPALTMITGQTLSWPLLALWTFSVSLVGIIVAIGLRRQMLIVDRLPFPFGIATAETVREMYARGKEAMARVYMLLGAGVVAALTKLSVAVFSIKKLALPGTLAGKASAYSLKNLTFALDPSFLMVAVGALIGLRACFSLLLGAVAAWAVLAPLALDNGWAQGGAADAYWYSSVNKWLLWPGVAMMVTASLTAFAFSWRSVLAAITGTRMSASKAGGNDAHEVPRKIFIGGLAGVLIASVICQFAIFGISLWTAGLGVLLTFLLAIVAARVSGETGITPVGPMGKVTQLMFGVISPGNATANLMAANVTGGAASQAGDLLHDMKAGLLLGASPRFQALAQVFGVMAGATVGSAVYLVLVPDPQNMLLTDEWPAPAVAAWKAVAEIFAKGMDAMPGGAVDAMLWAGGLGIVLAILEKTLPKSVRSFALSPASIGLAMIIPAYNSISIFFGGVIAYIITRKSKSWAERFLTVLASGLIAGESLTGIGIALQKILAG